MQCMPKSKAGKDWSETAIRNAQDALTQDFAPISDWRASAEYRALAARNLLQRFWLESEQHDAPAQLVRGGVA